MSDQRNVLEVVGAVIVEERRLVEEDRLGAIDETPDRTFGDSLDQPEVRARAQRIAVVRCAGAAALLPLKPRIRAGWELTISWVASAVSPWEKDIDHFLPPLPTDPPPSPVTAISLDVDAARNQDAARDDLAVDKRDRSTLL
ncbi:hypothetical protein [Rhizobium beringeri]|uniref:hypothetical protein n=1 Tax=Rhizobium beringeri TaxID=3019934 RepID=UPI002DDD2867|nr:hypothetical protein [Rhizobium beringeri]